MILTANGRLQRRRMRPEFLAYGCLKNPHGHEREWREKCMGMWAALAGCEPVLAISLNIRFWTIEPVSATAALFCPPQSHTGRRRNRRFPCRATPETDACVLAWRVCKWRRTVGSPPNLQSPSEPSPTYQNRESRTLSRAFQDHFAEVLARRQWPGRTEDSPAAHENLNSRCWRRLLPQILFGAIFRNFAVHRHCNNPLGGTILKLHDLVP